MGSIREVLGGRIKKILLDDISQALALPVDTKITDYLLSYIVTLLLLDKASGYYQLAHLGNKILRNGIPHKKEIQRLLTEPEHYEVCKHVQCDCPRTIAPLSGLAVLLSRQKRIVAFAKEISIEILLTTDEHRRGTTDCLKHLLRASILTEWESMNMPNMWEILSNILDSHGLRSSQEELRKKVIAQNKSSAQERRRRQARIRNTGEKIIPMG